MLFRKACTSEGSRSFLEELVSIPPPSKIKTKTNKYICIYPSVCCSFSGGISSEWVFSMMHNLVICVLPFFCASCGLDDDQVAPVYAKVFGPQFLLKAMWFYLILSQTCLLPPVRLLSVSGSLLGVSWVTPGCLLRVS